MDQIYPPLVSVSAERIHEIAGAMKEDSQIRIRIVGEDLEGRAVDKTVMLPLGKPGEGQARLAEAGLELRFKEGKAFVDNVVFGSVAERQKIDCDYEIASVEEEADRPPKQLFYLPALLLLALIVFLQRRRREPPTALQPA